VSGEQVPGAVAGRLGLLRVGFILALAGIGLFLLNIQVVGRDHYRQLALANSVKRVSIDAPRGLMLDRDGRVLVKNRPAFDALVITDRVLEVEQTMARARAVLALSGDDVERLAAALRTSRRAEIVAAEDLSLAEVASLEARALEWPEFRIREGLVRSYPHGATAAHGFGHMGEIHDRQLERDEFSDYRAGDVIGQSGLERRYESSMRGKRGSRWVVVDSRGRRIRELEKIESPRAGLDLQLTLDLDVQQAAEAAFGDRRGAAIAVDARTGEVLALVSRPAYDPNAFAGKLSGGEWRRYRSDPANPLFDRALLATLPPGSVFKLVDAIAGLEERTWNPDEVVTCNGSTVLHGDRFRCWRGGGHGPVRLYEAIRGSCNVYFYRRGDAVGIEGLAKWARKLGLGAPTGIDLDMEGPGLIPDPEWKRRVRNEPWWKGETVSVAIGQGAVQVSVLQVATMFQIIATGGRAYVPFLVASIGPDGQTRAPRVAHDVPLRRSTVARVQSALVAVVNEKGGTGRRARVDGYDVAGKTGTAQAPPGPAPGDKGEHAWFAGYAPGWDPEVVVAIFVERGGHGGTTAAPVAKAIFETVIRKRGIAPRPTAVADVAERPPEIQDAYHLPGLPTRSTATDTTLLSTLEGFPIAVSADGETIR